MYSDDQYDPNDVMNKMVNNSKSDHGSGNSLHFNWSLALYIEDSLDKFFKNKKKIFLIRFELYQFSCVQTTYV